MGYDIDTGVKETEREVSKDFALLCARELRGLFGIDVLTAAQRSLYAVYRYIARERERREEPLH